MRWFARVLNAIDAHHMELQHFHLLRVNCEKFNGKKGVISDYARKLEGMAVRLYSAWYVPQILADISTNRASYRNCLSFSSQVCTLTVDGAA